MTSIKNLKSALRNNLSLAILCLAVLAALPVHAETGAGRTVKYSQQDIVPVHAKVRFSTLIVLPQNEEILDFATDDKDFWIINGAHNLCYVHPAQTGIRTDLHLITSTGHVYSFLLTEIGNEPNIEPDLKIFIVPQEQSSVAGSTGLEGFVRTGEVEAYKKELEAMRSQTADEIRAAHSRSKPACSDLCRRNSHRHNPTLVRATPLLPLLKMQSRRNAGGGSTSRSLLQTSR
jgi:hypothetical protein